MKKYWLYFRLSLMRTFIYRGQLLVFTTASLLSVVPMIAVWLSLPNLFIASFSRSELISYYLIGLFIQRLIYSSLINYYVQEIVSDGSIAGLFLTKPVNFFWAVMGLNFGWLAVAMVVGFVMTFTFALLVGIDPVVQLTGLSLAMTAAATLLGIFLVFVTSLLIGLISFWTVNISSIVSLYWIALLFLGGITLPLAFFPEAVKSFVNLSPFRFMFSFPLEILLGKITWMESLWGYLLGIAWVSLFVLIYRFVWERGNRVYTSYGQ